MKNIIAWGKSLELGKKLSELLNYKLVIPEVTNFPNIETKVFFNNSILSNEVIVLFDVKENPNYELFNLFLVLDAIKNNSKVNVTLLSSWLPYSPQDKIFRVGEPLSSKMLINILESLGVNKFVFTDIHSEKIFEFISVGYENILPIEKYANYAKKQLKINKNNTIIAILDDGDCSRAIKYSKILGLDTLKLEKKRSRETGEVQFSDLEINLDGKDIIIVDDFVSTGSTLIKSSDFLKSKGANSYSCFVTHVVVEETLNKIINSSIDYFYSADRVVEKYNNPKLKFIDTTDLLVKVI